MNDQEILDNAPDGATHYDSYEYMRHIHDGLWEYWSKAVGWEETVAAGETRSLTDIARIVELEKDYSEDGYDYLTFANEDTSGRHRSLADIKVIVELRIILRGRDELIRARLVAALQNLRKK